MRRGTGRLPHLALVAAVVIGCSAEPPDRPTTPVHRALEAVIAHDPDRVNGTVCRDRRAEFSLGSLLPGLLSPVQALPGGDMRRTLSVIRLDASGLSLTEQRAGTTVAVRIRGDLVERFVPAQVEVLFRAYAAEAGEPVDDALLGDTLRNVSFGDVRIPIDQLVPVVREDGTWRVCPPAATP
jgi:hypothetical protein